MSTTTSRFLRALLCLAALGLSSGGAMASKPDGAGHGKMHKVKQPEEVKVGAYFGDSERTAATEYYGGRRAKGHCPPGLAKKNNGCLPPGQAKKWTTGQPLPAAVVVYPVPRELVVQIGLPPVGHKYVRVANDILLIAIGSRMVVDAIEDLMKL